MTSKRRPKQRSSNSASHSAPATALAAAQSWGYQLQKLDISVAAASPFDVLVIDYALDGDQRTALSPDDLARLKRQPDGGRRLVYAYLSVGEAESYRYYWQRSWKTSPPQWLLSENPDWEGNFLVAFWNSDWRHILIDGDDSYISRIAAAGFDGLYLDRCDVFEDLPDAAPEVAEQVEDLEAAMVGFVATLSSTIHTRFPQLGIIMQNAEQLLEHDKVLQAIDGIAKEELLYGESGGTRRNAKRQIAETTEALNRARGANKAVLCVEYLDDRNKRQEAAEEIRRLGFVPYMARADRELDTLEEPVPASA